MNEKKFIEELEKIGIKISNRETKMFNQYYEFLISENKKYNLTRITSKEEVYLKHYYDSATISQILKLATISNMCDVGSGAGFPGVVIKILFPKIKVSLIEASQKKCLFLKDLAKKLNIEINVLNIRAENYAEVEEFDLVTARALSSSAIIVELTARMIKKEGHLVLYKTDISREIKQLNKSLIALKFEIDNAIDFSLIGEKGKRGLILLKKRHETPKNFPRTYNLIKKTPLI